MSFSLLHNIGTLHIVLILLLSWAVYSYTNAYLTRRHLKRKLNAHWPKSSTTRLPALLRIIIDLSTILIKRLLKIEINNLIQYKYIFDGRPEERYKAYMIETIVDRLLFTIDPENIKAVLATQFNDFGKGPVFHRMWFQFLGNGIFNVDGQEWAHSRALLRPQFLKTRVSDLACFETHMQELFSVLNVGETVDMQDIWHRFTLDSATDFLFGQSVQSLLNPKIRFAEAFSKIQYLQIIRMQLGGALSFYRQGEFSEAIDTLNSFVEPFVERAVLKSYHKEDDKDTEKSNFLDALADFTNDKKVLRDQLVSTLLAGRDTTACTLTFLTYFIAQNPSVFNRLRAEILDTVGKEDMPTYADLKGMKYLQNVINETLRLCPIVPVNIRTAFKDTTLPRGGGADGSEPIVVPKGTMIIYSALLLQRRQDLFGEDVNEFKPERWEEWQPKPWEYIPFV